VRDYLRPSAWYWRWHSVRSMRSVATWLDDPDLHDLVQKADNAAAVEDDRAFFEAIGSFLESFAGAQSRR
jgi:hypothetical protein